MNEFKLNGDYITLTAFLKAVGIISSGGQAKIYLASNKVFINQIQIDQRNKKLYLGDIVEINKTKYKLV